MSLTREDILGADDVVIEKVSVPNWPNSKLVYVRTLDSERQDAFEAEWVELNKTDRGLQQLKARLGAYCMCDEAGAYLFGLNDVDALSKKSGIMLARVADVAWRINLFGEEAVKEMVENSGGDPSANTG